MAYEYFNKMNKAGKESAKSFTYNEKTYVAKNNKNRNNSLQSKIIIRG
jgi:hypothetical protein